MKMRSLYKELCMRTHFETEARCNSEIYGLFYFSFPTFDLGVLEIEMQIQAMFYCETQETMNTRNMYG